MYIYTLLYKDDIIFDLYNNLKSKINLKDKNDCREIYRIIDYLIVKIIFIF